MSELPEISRREAIKWVAAAAGAVGLGVWIAHEEATSTRQPESTPGPDPTTTTESTLPTTVNDPERPSGEQLSVKAYVDTYRGYAQEVEEQFGIDHQVVLAQSYVETGGASSELATQANAFFGIKAREEEWDGPTYITDSPEEPADGGEHQDQTSVFRRYESVKESFLDYGNRITTSGFYDDAVAVRDNPEAYITSMGSVYATDSSYAEKILAKYQEVLAVS
jgi:flagellum-specific peptidoglycan hydrolase FlgJ